MTFILVSGEYPPQKGGVADYTFQVAEGLRKHGATVEVIVFCEARTPPEKDTYFVGRALNPISFNRASRIIERVARDCVVIVQYVPQMYGLKGMNLPWVLWLCRLKASRIWVMFHEVQVASPKGSPWKHRLLAYITHDMARRLARRGDRCFVSTSSFASLVDKFTRTGVEAEWLPVPSNLDLQVNQEEVNRLRARLLGSGAPALIGHLGLYRGVLRSLLQRLLDHSRHLHPEWKFVFIGRGSEEFLSQLHCQGLPASCAIASGELGSREAACWIKACDVMVQPYPDGLSTRRTSLMAALALGKATVSNLGHLSEHFWNDNPGIYLARSPHPWELVAGISTVLGDKDLQNRLESGAALLYTQQFHLNRTIERLNTC